MAELLPEDKDLVRALKRTWDVIAEDTLDCGGVMTRMQVAEFTCDYISEYSHETKEVRAEYARKFREMSDARLARLAREAFPSARYSR